MALKNMMAEEMVVVSSAWVEPENLAHVKIQAVPRLKGLLTDITAAHEGIFAVVPKDNPRLAEISRLASEEDSVHDRIVRSIYNLLDSAALMLDDQGEKFIKVRDALMPEGPGSIIHASYRAQAGHIALLREQMSAETKATLKEFPLPNGSNLLERVEAWIAAGERLGELEEERARIEKLEPSVGMQIVRARHQWVRAVNALVSVAALAELDDETDRIIFAPLRDAEAKADARAARRSAASVPDELAPVQPTA